VSAAVPGRPGEELVSDADHAQLARLVTEAAWRVDFGRPETLHELFMDEGTLNVGQGVLRGREQIRQWGRDLAEAQTYQCIRHVCGNMRFVADGGDAAEGITVLTVYMNAGDGPGTTLPWTIGEDHDRFVRTDRGWRFASRYWTELFVRKES
jgi:hypothetical protein